MNGTRYMISDAAKRVSVEAHVLRYWEEELKLPIGRNELGQRYYTEEDIQRFKRIKEMKDSGFQLKAIRMVLNSKSGIQDGEAVFLGSRAAGERRMSPVWDADSQAPGTRERDEGKTDAGERDEEKRSTRETEAGERVERKRDTRETEAGAMDGVAGMGEGRMSAGEYMIPKASAEETAVESGVRAGGREENRSAENAAKLTMLLKKMLLEVLEENNLSLIRSVEDTMGERVIKEMNYLFREQEEREEERFRLFDESLRKRQKKKKQPSGRRRGKLFFKKEKSLP